MANKKRTIAICFSNAKDRKLVVGHLSGLGHNLIEFRKEAGIQADLFVLDIPSARRLGKQVLSLKNTENVFLPVMIALGKRDSLDPWLKAGYDDCLRKPFNTEELEVKVSILLRLRQQAEKLIQKGEARYQAIFDAAGTASLIVEEDTTIVMANTECLRITGYSPKELIGTKWPRYVAPESLEIMMKYHIARRQHPEDIPEQYEVRLIDKEQRVRDVHLNIKMVPGTKQSVVSMLDITEAKRTEELTQVRIRLFEYAGRHTLEELLRKTLDDVGKLVDSPIGFYHFVEADQKTLSLQTWSTQTLERFCKASATETHYSIDKAGVWVDCVRQRRPVVHNDYASLPHRKGMPEGHAAVIRELVVPILRNKRVVAILGVGNKPRDYTERDADIVAYLADIAWEIAEHKRAEDSLRSSERKLSEAQRIARVGSWEWDILANKTEWSSELYRIFGVTPKEFDPNAFERFLACIHPQDRERVAQSMEQALILKDSFDIVYRIIRPDGSERHIQAMVHLTVENNGQVTRMYGISQDITERTQAEDALKKNEIRFRSLSTQFTSLLDAIPDTLILHSPDLKVLWANNSAAAAMGKDMLDIVGNYCYALFHNSTTPCDPCPVLKSFRTGEQESATITTPDMRLLELRTIPIIEDGRVVNVIELSRDITEHRKLEEQLRQGQKMEAIGRLAGGVAHDFNNMLNVILGYGELVLGKLHDDHTLREEVEQIIKAAERSAALTRQLLAFSRKQPLQPEILDLNALLQNLDKMLHRLIGEDVDLEMAFAEDLARVEIDPAQIEQVIMNLAINSHDAMPSGGTLTIETSNVELDGLYAQTHEGVEPGGYVMISVTDNGCGMDNETMSRVFDPFYTTKEKGKGTGLGLATVYGIVKQSGGNISVTSKKGQGTTFKIFLPRTDGKPDIKKVLPQEGVRRGHGKQVLVVEDETALRGLFMALLTDLDYNVSIAANGSEALLLMEQNGFKPDLVITDVVMPGMRVEEMVERLRKRQPGLKVIYMSGYTDDAIGQNKVIDPDKPFIQKPFTIKEIITRIEQVMHGEDKLSR
jgi:two-component system cell cycle sensor histidine kinase/response regulator CckA